MMHKSFQSESIATISSKHAINGMILPFIMFDPWSYLIISFKYPPGHQPRTLQPARWWRPFASLRPEFCARIFSVAVELVRRNGVAQRMFWSSNFKGVKIISLYGYAATVALGEEEWRSYPIPAVGITSLGRGFDGAGASVEAQRASKLKDWKCTSQLAWAVCSLGMWTAPHGFLPQRWDAVWYCACLENHQDATSVFNVFEVDWGHNS